MNFNPRNPNIHLTQKIKSALTPVVLLSVVLLGVLIYSNTFQASFHFDDSNAIEENPAIRRLGDVHAIWDAFNTRVVAGFSFSLNYAFGKLNPFGYHLFNITCHLFSSLLVYALVLLTFQTPALNKSSLKDYRRLLGLSSSLLFLVHPIQTQAVNYIWQRVTSLASFFYLASVVLYVRARLHKNSAIYLGSLLTTLLGMFTKEIAVTIPITLSLYEFSFFGPLKERARQRLLWLLPFLLTLLVIPFTLLRSNQVTLRLMKSPSLTAPAAEGRTLPEALSSMTRWSSPSGQLPRREYLLTQVNVLRTYLRLLLFPVHQNLDYDYPLSRHVTEPKTLFSLLLLIALLILALKAFQRHRLVAFGIFWFLTTLSIESLVVLPDVIFEHRLYLPMVGYALFLPNALFLLLKDTRRFISVFSLIVLIFSIATYRRNNVWREEIPLWQDVIQKSPKRARPHVNLGVAYGKRGEYDKEIAYCLKAIELNPNYPKSYSNLGIAYGQKGEYDKAIEYTQKTLQLEPESAKAYNNLGVAYGKKGDSDKEILCCLKAIELDPYYAQAYNNLGVAYGKKGRHGEALQYCQRAIDLDPDFVDAHFNVGLAHRKKGNQAGVLRQADQLRALHRQDLADQLEQASQ